MTTMKHVATAVVMLVLSGPAAHAADFHNGNDLYEYCSTPRDRVKVGIYASGVIGGISPIGKAWKRTLSSCALLISSEGVPSLDSS